MANVGTPAAIFRGGKSFAIQPEEYSFSMDGGFTRTVTYLGTRGGIAGLMSQFEIGGYTFTANFSNPVARISGTISQNPEDPNQTESDKYTMHQETLDQDIFSLEGVEEEAQRYSSNTGEALNKYKKIIEVAVKNASIQEMTDEGLNVGVYPLAFQVYVELSRGAESFENHYSVLTRTRTVPIAWIGRLDLATISLIYTSNGMIATFGLPPTISALFPPVPSTVAPNSIWGWRRRRQSIDYQDDGFRAVITQDWTFAQWSTFIYGVA